VLDAEVRREAHKQSVIVEHQDTQRAVEISELEIAKCCSDKRAAKCNKLPSQRVSLLSSRVPNQTTEPPSPTSGRVAKVRRDRLVTAPI
jgi:hypothetical protein